MKVESPEKEIERFNQIFDEGESFEEAIQSVQGLFQDNPIIEDEVKRLMRNIENYRKAVNSLENIRKNRNNYSVYDIEESDRKRKIFHDGIISSIQKIAKLLPDNPYFKKISQLERGKIGEKALFWAEYFRLKEKIKEKAA